MTGLHRQLADFISGLRPEHLSDKAIATASLGIADCIAVMIAGANEEPVALVREICALGTAGDAAAEIPGGRLWRAADAALINGAASHVLDYDDVALDGHPSAVLTPAILAEGQAVKASGRDAIVAYIAGYELWGALIEREPGKFIARGFHPTAIHGALAAAAACANLHRLDADRCAHAIGIAASLAAGLVANFGTMTKSLHAGRSAQAGVLAARLARRGFTASPDIIEHRTGYLQAHSPSGRPDIAPSDLQLGHRWRIESAGLNIKRYPVCYATHRSVDAMIGLATKHDLTTDAVSEIHVKIGEAQRLMLRNHEPKTALEAKFSIEFAVAAGLIARAVGLSQLTEEFVRSSDVISTMRKVRCSTTSEMMVDLPLAPFDELSVKLVSGELITHEPVAFARGSTANPLSESEFKAKFVECVGASLGASQTASLHAAVTTLWNECSLLDLPFTGRG